MNKTPITIKDSVSAGWQLTKSNFGILLASLAVLMAISLGLSIADNIITASSSKSPANSVVVALLLASLVVMVLRIGIQNLTSIGFTRIQLNILDDKTTSIGQLFNSENLFWRYLGTSVVYALIVIGGLILLIVPGVIWGIKYQFALPLVVDKKMKLGESLTRSGQITKGYKGWLFGFSLVLGLLNIGGLLALGFGLLLTIPITVMSQIWVYRKLLTNYSSKAK